MALKIRLSRGGAKKRPYYRIVIADSRSPRDGRFIEKIGSYNPMLAKDNPDRVVLNLERARHWLGRGATPSDRVARFLGNAEVIPMPAQRNNPQKAVPKTKAQERMKAAEEAAKAPAEEPPAEEAVAEEGPAEAGNQGVGRRSGDCGIRRGLGNRLSRRRSLWSVQRRMNGYVSAPSLGHME